MGESIQEPIAVETTIAHTRVMPARILWKQRVYICMFCGMHHTVYEGDTLFHIFYMTTKESCMQIALNTKTLRWTLVAIEAV